MPCCTAEADEGIATDGLEPVDCETLGIFLGIVPENIADCFEANDGVCGSVGQPELPSKVLFVTVVEKLEKKTTIGDSVFEKDLSSKSHFFWKKVALD